MRHAHTKCHHSRLYRLLCLPPVPLHPPSWTPPGHLEHIDKTTNIHRHLLYCCIVIHASFFTVAFASFIR
jgi:hypothetical protein